jgi:hypothetical protein
VSCCKHTHRSEPFRSQKVLNPANVKNLLTRDAFYKAARVHPASRYRGDAVARVWLRCKVRTSDHAWLRRSRQPTRIGLVFLLPGPLAPRLHQWDAFRNALGEQARATWKAGTSP